MATGTNIIVNYCVVEFSPDVGSALITQKSSDFNFQNRKCRIKVNFGWGMNDDRQIKVYIESEPSLSANFYVTVFVLAGKNTIRYPQEKVLDINRFIWSSSLGDLRTKLPSIDIKSMKFRFIFQKDLEYNHDQSSSGSKMVQTSPVLNDINSLDRFSDDLSRILNNGTMCDVQVKCGDIVINAHKAVLRARSPYFENLLQSTTGNQLRIPHMDPAAFRALMEYIYGGKYPELSFELAKNIYMSGDISDTGCLREISIQFLTDNLTRHNACECLAFARDDYFKERVMKYIIDEELVFKEEHWKTFCEQNPKPANYLLNILVRIMRQQRSIEGMS